MADTPKKDPTVTSAKPASASQGVAPPIHEADDYAADREYKDVPDDEKPAPESVAQVEVPPTSGAFADKGAK